MRKKSDTSNIPVFVLLRVHRSMRLPCYEHLRFGDRRLRMLPIFRDNKLTRGLTSK